MITRQVNCGNVLIGGGAPISVQSMTNVDSRDEAALLRQIFELTDAGCQIVRVAVFDMEAAQVFEQVRKKVKVPLVADIHFDYRLAIAAIKAGADKIRINPGNIGCRRGGERTKHSNKSRSQFRIIGKRHSRKIRRRYG